MARHLLVLDDMELTALITHLEGQNEMMCESRLNCSNPSETPDREEVLLNLVYESASQPIVNAFEYTRFNSTSSLSGISLG